MTMYAGMACSVIDELPAGRRPVTTTVMASDRRSDVVARVASACEAGTQAYWVCTLIEESEVLECQAAEETFKELGAELSPLRVGLVHGRLSPAEKERVMTAFKTGEIELLVAQEQHLHRSIAQLDPRSRCGRLVSSTVGITTASPAGWPDRGPTEGRRPIEPRRLFGPFLRRKKRASPGRAKPCHGKTQQADRKVKPAPLP